MEQITTIEVGNDGVARWVDPFGNRHSDLTAEQLQAARAGAIVRQSAPGSRLYYHAGAERTTLQIIREVGGERLILLPHGWRWTDVKPAAEDVWATAPRIALT